MRGDLTRFADCTPKNWALVAISALWQKAGIHRPWELNAYMRFGIYNWYPRIKQRGITIDIPLFLWFVLCMCPYTCLCSKNEQHACVLSSCVFAHKSVIHSFIAKHRTMNVIESCRIWHDRNIPRHSSMLNTIFLASSTMIHQPNLFACERRGLYNNRFTGTVPTELGVLTGLTMLCVWKGCHMGRVNSMITVMSRVTCLRTYIHLSSLACAYQETCVKVFPLNR